MSYLNNVAIGMDKKDSVNFISNLSTNCTDNHLKDYSFELIQYPNYNILRWKDIKWSSCDKDVEWVNNYLKKLDDMGHPVAFSRIGEDISDCEEWYNDAGEQIWTEKLQICRQFAFEMKSV